MHKFEGYPKKHRRAWHVLVHTDNHDTDPGNTSAPLPGDCVRVTTRNGKVWFAMIDRFLDFAQTGEHAGSPIVSVRRREGKRIPGRLQGQVIRVLTDENPRRVGSKGRMMVQYLLDHGPEMHVEQWYLGGGNTEELDKLLAKDHAVMLPDFGKVPSGVVPVPVPVPTRGDSGGSQEQGSGGGESQGSGADPMDPASGSNLQSLSDDALQARAEGLESLRDSAASQGASDNAMAFQRDLDDVHGEQERREREAQDNAKPKRKDSAPPKPAYWDRIMTLARLRQNILLVGPAGCGKTYIAGKVAEALELPFASLSCTAGVSESALTGWLLPVEAGGTFSYVPAPFVEVYENGGVFLFDEVDAADENMLLTINQALANGSFTVPHRIGNATVKRHENFVAIAAANTFGLGESIMYSGRTQLDGATLDRFRAGVIEMDYDANVERKLVHPDVLRWGREIRKAIKLHKLEKIMSTRILLDFSRQAEAGLTQTDWEASYFADWTRDERDKVTP